MFAKTTIRLCLMSALFATQLVWGHPNTRVSTEAMDSTTIAAGHTPMADKGMSLDEAVSVIRRRTGGKVVRSETVKKGGKRIHMIRVLTKDGHMRDYRVDAKTGRIS